MSSRVAAGSGVCLMSASTPLEILLLDPSGILNEGSSIGKIIQLRWTSHKRPSKTAALRLIMEKTAVQLPWRPTAGYEPGGRRSIAPCVFFTRGHCRNGQTCSFSHTAASPELMTSGSTIGRGDGGSTVLPSNGQIDTRGQVPCRFHLRGGCIKGMSCPFAHPNVEAVNAADPPSTAQVRAAISTDPTYGADS